MRKYLNVVAQNVECRGLRNRESPLAMEQYLLSV